MSADKGNTRVGFQCTGCCAWYDHLHQAARHLQSQKKIRGFCCRSTIFHATGKENPNILGIKTGLEDDDVAQQKSEVLAGRDQYHYQINAYKNDNDGFGDQYETGSGDGKDAGSPGQAASADDGICHGNGAASPGQTATTWQNKPWLNGVHHVRLDSSVAPEDGRNEDVRRRARTFDILVSDPHDTRQYAAPKGGKRSSLDGKDLKNVEGAKHQQEGISVTPDTSKKRPRDSDVAGPPLFSDYAQATPVGSWVREGTDSGGNMSYSHDARAAEARSGAGLKLKQRSTSTSSKFNFELDGFRSPVPTSGSKPPAKDASIDPRLDQHNNQGQGVSPEERSKTLKRLQTELTNFQKKTTEMCTYLMKELNEWHDQLHGPGSAALDILKISG
jgi:hypothetical protein